MSYPPPADSWPDPSPAPGISPQPPPPVVGDVLPPGAMPAPAYPVGAFATPPGPPGFSPMGYPPPYPYLPPPRTNGMAVASLVVSIISAVGLCFYGFGGLLGIVGALLGHVAKRQVRDRGEAGDGLAMAGLIIGWVAFGLAVVIVGIVVVFFWWAFTVGSSSGF